MSAFVLMRWLRLVAVLGAGAVLLSACGESLEDAIADAEAGYVSMDRAARQGVIDALQDALDRDAELAAADRGRATAWLGALLVRQGQFDAVRSLLADFDAMADHLIAAGDPVSAVRGLGAWGGALVRLQLYFEVAPPLRRALLVAQERDLMTHPVVIDALIDMAWVTYFIPFHDSVGRQTLADPTVAADSMSRHVAAEVMLRQAEEIARTQGGLDDPRIGSIDMIRGVLLMDRSFVPGGGSVDIDIVHQNVALLLGSALNRMPRDHPDRVVAAEIRAEISAGSCDVAEMERWSQEAVKTALTIYGPAAERTFQARETRGELLMQIGDVTRGRRVIISARKARYADGGEDLGDPIGYLQDDGPVRHCIDPPR